MFRAALVLLCLAVVPAFAAEPQGRVEMVTGGGRGLGLFADINRSIEDVGVGRHIRESSMAGVSWRGHGFTLSAGGGVYDHDLTGTKQGRARIVSFAVGHELATGRVGTLSLELRRSRLWEGETTLDVTGARLGWSLKF